MFTNNSKSTVNKQFTVFLIMEYIASKILVFIVIWNLEVTVHMIKQELSMNMGHIALLWIIIHVVYHN
jgi:hypothetical protein